MSTAGLTGADRPGKEVIGGGRAKDENPESKDDETSLTVGVIIAIAEGRIGRAKKVENIPELLPDSTDGKEMLKTLRDRFTQDPEFHKGLDWDKIRKTLEVSPKVLWSINEMEKAGHNPDICFSYKTGFSVDTCSKESPESGMNCVYDEDMEHQLMMEDPKAIFNGRAKDMAEAMGIDLMSPEYYKCILQKKGRFDLQTKSYLKSDNASRGINYVGYRYGENGERVHVSELFRRNPDVNIGWRGSLWVPWAA